MSNDMKYKLLRWFAKMLKFEGYCFIMIMEGKPSTTEDGARCIESILTDETFRDKVIELHKKHIYGYE